MIRSFKDRKTEAVFNGECPKGFPQDIFRVARRKLTMIDAATSLNDLRAVPDNKLHPLKEDRAGQCAIWLNDQYRVCFVWTNDGAESVEIADYH